jgi:hypothetical protein
MNQVFCLGKAYRDRHGIVAPIGAGLAALFLIMSAACGGDPMTGEDEPIATVFQGGGGAGWNGVTPEILADNHLATTSTDAAGVTVGGGDPVKLCDSLNYNPFTNKLECSLASQWVKWLTYYGNPAHPITQDRHQLLGALIDCSMHPDILVHIPGFPSEDGMFDLYKDWVSLPLPLHYRQLLSSCVAAKVNAFGVSVAIAFNGPGPTSFLPDPITDPAFMYQEATFFGDLFGSDPVVMACSGKKTGGGSYPAGKNLRICGQLGNPCHVKALGPCEGLSTSFCDSWAGSNANPGMGAGEYCVSTNNGVGDHWKYPLTVYLETEPELIDGDVDRCGLKGDQPCDEDSPNGT